MDESSSSAHSSGLRKKGASSKRGRPNKSTPEKREANRLRQKKFRAQKSARLHDLQKRYAILFDLDPNSPQVETLRKEIKELRQQLRTSASHFTTPENVRSLGFQTPSTDATSSLPSTSTDPAPPSVAIDVRNSIFKRILT